nr:hypothetical protein [Microbispora sp. GKU 823]
MSLPISAPSVEYENDAPPAEQAVHQAVHDIAGAHHDQGLAEQVGDLDRGQRGQRAVGPYAHDRAAAQQFGRGEVGRQVVAAQVVHQPEVEAPLPDAPVDLGLLGADDLDLGRRMGLPERPYGGDQQRDRGRVDRAQPDHAGRVVLLVGRAAQAVHRLQHAVDVRQQLAALVADGGAGPASLQEIDAEFPLQVAHGLAQRRLGQVQVVGRPAERAEAGHRTDVLELLDAHRRPPRPGGSPVVFKGDPTGRSAIFLLNK